MPAQQFGDAGLGQETAQAVGTQQQPVVHLHRQRYRVDLRRFIGARADEPPKIDSVTLPVQVDDRLLLCSDGLCGFLPEARIAELLSRHADPDACCSRLIEATLSETDAGDNVTVVVARVRG